MSNSLYTPAQAALDTVTEPWSEAFRTQRDVGLRVPINYLTAAATSLRTSCFSHNQYENTAFQRCFSNLLAVGFRRFIVDVYWDTGRSEWSLCPVQVPASESNSEVSPVAGLSSAAATISPDASGTAARRKRQDDVSSTVSGSASASSVGASPASSESSVPSLSAPGAPESTSIISYPTDYNMPLFQVGNYNCTSTMTLSYLTGILEGFVDETSTTTEARVTFLVLNLHAAAPMAAPNSPAQQPSPDQMPGEGHFLSDVVQGNLTDELYTPQELSNERSNLAKTWDDTSWDTRPMAGYYETFENSDGQTTTVNGWPTEAHMEFKEYFRLVAGIGTIDPQMASYDIGADQNILFGPDTINTYHETTLSPTGSLASGCLFDASNIDITATTNSSWAVSVTDVDIPPNPNVDEPIPIIANTTSCGLSPFLNTTLASTTADQNPLPYAAFVHSTLWSWAAGEPRNATSTHNGATGNRCAVMNTAADANAGRWRTADCNERHRAACHDPSSPYNWRLSRDPASYFSADTVCPPPFVFSAPHTALENAHLLAAIRADASAARADDVFLNLNSMQIKDCWVLSINGTCPYRPPTDSDRTRVVVVPTVAAVIIFVCAALTFFVKCAANRREDKRGRRRRMVGGWEYEGVPS
ncbi:hypothetical protein BS50DRAFT_618385 [Corynespora cassiicola Philippines]|uniref:Maintenance of telomere capping protein 6 n=1 Tax=Corynespora cassiicola Philippines TaxID=1448308 RepID=A0A2T2P0Z1_CORCC|nr:hypothetical protein BS50DRAFT_618385 [Corynespora cassiicola Philippines]